MHSDRGLELSLQHHNSFLPTNGEGDLYSHSNEDDNVRVFVEKCSFSCGLVNYLLIS